MSFVNKIVKSGAVPVHFVTCKDLEGRDCYYFVLAPREKMQMLKQVKSESFDINDYGKIIACGYGLTPSAEVKEKLKTEYGIDISGIKDKSRCYF